PGDAGVYAMAVEEDSPTRASIIAAGYLSSNAPHYSMARLTACTPCYANCDMSPVGPALNIFDFACFLNRFAAGDSYANCDGSTTDPVLTVADFSCFLNAFAAGCP